MTISCPVLVIRADQARWDAGIDELTMIREKQARFYTIRRLRAG
tara:strand:+ start:295 stop:426 length:132 start_codon:yes stop_codon:yes gene_type:complete